MRCSTPRPGEKGWSRWSAYLWSKQQYKDFEVEFDYKVEKQGNSGFYFHVGDKNDPVKQGIELNDDSASHPPEKPLNDHDSGGIIPGVPPTKRVAKPAGEWNHFQVTVQGGKVVVKLNGEVVNELALDNPKISSRPATGYIGFQDHGLPLALRNIQLRDQKLAGGWAHEVDGDGEVHDEHDAKAGPTTSVYGRRQPVCPGPRRRPRGDATLRPELAAAAKNGFAFAVDSRLEVLSSAGQGGEGPAWDREWGILSTGKSGIHRRSADGVESTLRSHAGTNGLLFDSERRLLACEPKQRRVTRMQRDGTLEVLTDVYDGRPYNQPNDLALDSRPDLLFRRLLRRPAKLAAAHGRRSLGRRRLPDRRSRQGACVLGPDDVERANGVLVSADDKHLFVADNCNDRLGGARKLYRFALSDDGTIVAGSRTLLDDWGEGRGPDGIKQDANGNLYVAGGTNAANPPVDNSRPGGIYVLDPQSGKLLGFLRRPTR